MHETSNRNPSPSRLGLKKNGAVGEIVEVQGGHIVRSTGKKDRHSKVCTAKGPRDRRVRLAAHTAIQFYDVQDRLGYDRPSKAVDWLIMKAKSAIDDLAELPPWHPTLESAPKQENQHNKHQAIPMLSGNEQISSFLPPSLDSDAIADTIKSFFPMAAAGDASSSAVQFQTFSTNDGNNNSSSSQDLRLSLQSFQDPIFHHHTPPPPSHGQHVLLSGIPLGFDPQLQRIPLWNSSSDTTTSAAGFLFNYSPSPQLLGGYHNPYLTSSSQRGPLQSSNTPSFRARMDPSSISTTEHHHPGASLPVYSGGFSGFHIPARIQEEHDSASSDSRH